MFQILLVEDTPLEREILTDSLAGEGYALLEAPNGRVAERMLFESHIDLVVSDINMPEMNGLELTERIKFINPQIKIILITGEHKADNLRFCLGNNIARYLKKPFKIEEFRLAVSTTLHEKTSESVQSMSFLSKQWLEIDLFSSGESLMRMHKYMELYLEDFIPKKDAVQIAWSIFEMLKNAMEWGNEFKKELTAHISCMVLKDRIIIKIKDQGKGFNVAAALNPNRDHIERALEREKAGKRPGGYGIEIVKNVMDGFFYNESGNCLIMTKIVERLKKTEKEKEKAQQKT